MICNNCKSEIPNDSKFCEVCGSSVNTPPPAPQPQYQQVPPPIQPQYQQVPPPVQPQYGAPQGYQQAPQYQQRPPYAQGGYNQTANAGNPPPLSVGQYIIMWVLQLIPLVGIIMLFVWAFSSTENPNKRNYARAILLISLIVIVLYIIIAVIAVAVGGSIFSNVMNSFDGYGSF